ncbi:hypothetical protein [Rhodopila globiformis]|uniref:hypothetical protein n=1 Tax=Rhodopila globiformis TaxID=1071 RepID=UPI0011B05CFC|nr:hypothetical protein [Rhodopila globiformis]
MRHASAASRITTTAVSERLDLLGSTGICILIGDRGYPQPDGLRNTLASGVDVLVRLTWNSLSLTTHDGQPVDWLALCEQADGTGCVDIPVRVHKAHRRRWQIEIWPSWCVSRLTKGLRDSHAMPKLAQAAEFGFIDADQPQAVAQHRDFASSNDTALNPSIDSAVWNAEPRDKLADGQLSGFALLEPGDPAPMRRDRDANAMQQLSHHVGGKGGALLGWHPALRIQGLCDHRRFVAAGMQVLDALQQGGMIAHLCEVRDRPPQRVVRLHAARPMAFHGNRLAVTFHRHDDAFQHQPSDGLPIGGRCIYGHPYRRTPASGQKLNKFNWLFSMTVSQS